MSDLDPITDPDPARPGCAAGQAALQRLLDGEPAWDTPEAAAHRASCTDCREELALAGSLARLPADVVVPAGLTDRVVSSAVAAHRRRRVLRYGGIGVALAASVLVAVVAFRPWETKEPQPGPVAVLPPKPEPVPPQPAPAPPKPLGESVAEARDALVSLTKRTANETRDQSALLVPAPKMPEPTDPAEGLEPLADARTGAARSVEPIAGSARRAFNFFLKAADPPDRRPD